MKDFPNEERMGRVEKYEVPIKRFSPTPQSLRALYTLRPEPRQDVCIERVPLRQVFKQLYEGIFRKQLRNGLGQQTMYFWTLAAMAKNMPVFRVTRPTHPFLLDALADRIDAHLRGEPPCAGADAAAGQAVSSAVAGG